VELHGQLPAGVGLRARRPVHLLAGAAADLVRQSVRDDQEQLRLPCRLRYVRQQPHLHEQRVRVRAGAGHAGVRLEAVRHGREQLQPDGQLRSQRHDRMSRWPEVHIERYLLHADDLRRAVQYEPVRQLRRDALVPGEQLRGGADLLPNELLHAGQQLRQLVQHDRVGRLRELPLVLLRIGRLLPEPVLHA
jgi:hypothetical protein